ncbi:MAG TPA: 50S ribosomal protein L32 [Patescibacteria group bacterium]
MTPLPKKKHTRSRSNQRRNSVRLGLPTLVRCPNCGKFKLPHKECSNCGHK